MSVRGKTASLWLPEVDQFLVRWDAHRLDSFREDWNGILLGSGNRLSVDWDLWATSWRWKDAKSEDVHSSFGLPCILIVCLQLLIFKNNKCNILSPNFFFFFCCFFDKALQLFTVQKQFFLCVQKQFFLMGKKLLLSNGIQSVFNVSQPFIPFHDILSTAKSKIIWWYSSSWSWPYRMVCRLCQTNPWLKTSYPVFVFGHPSSNFLKRSRNLWKEADVFVPLCE